MADQKKKKADEQGLTIPDDVRKNHPELIEMILGSESMNNEERQYWINILPIMTPDQIENLQGILVNEKKQLAAIDRKYSKEIEQIGEVQLLKKVEEERRNRRTDRQANEGKSEMKEEEATEDILQQISDS